MSAFRETMTSDLRRYARSWGVWPLALVAPVAARFWVPRPDGSAISITIDGRLPVLDSGVIGLSLGAVVSTMFVLAVWGYLRANVTHRRAWQIIDVSPASRIAVTLGRFGADLTVMLLLLGALTVAGWLLAAVSLHIVRPLPLVATLWLVALPPLICVVGIRHLFDGLPLLRGIAGDIVFFTLWITTLVLPFVGGADRAGLSGAMRDLPGFARLLAGGDVAHPPAVAIGMLEVRPGTMPVDVSAGIESGGYIASRLSWCLIGFGVALFAGLVCRSPGRSVTIGKTRATDGWIAAPFAPPANTARRPFAAQMLAEMASVFSGTRLRWLVPVAALAGCVGSYRHLGGPAGLLLLAIGLPGHVGRWEARGLRPLTITVPTSLWHRRSASVLAVTLWGALLAVPAAMYHLDPAPILLEAAMATVGAIVAVPLAAISRSPTVPRIVLLLLWYGYFSA